MSARVVTPGELRARAGELRALAEQLDAMDALCPDGVTRAGGILVIPVALHDVLCGWRVGESRETTPPVLACPGCGLGYLVDEIRGRGQCGAVR